MDISYQCHILRDLLRNLSLGQVFKGLPSLHFALWLLKDALYSKGYSFLVCQEIEGAAQAYTTKVYQNCWKEWTAWCAQETVPNSIISAPKVADFLHYLFRVGLAWHTSSINNNTFSAFVEQHHYSASNHPIISKLMHQFYLQHPPWHKCFDSLVVEHLFFLLRVGLQPLLTDCKLVWKTATFLAIITAKHFSNLTLLYTDSQHLFL